MKVEEAEVVGIIRMGVLEVVIGSEGGLEAGGVRGSERFESRLGDAIVD